MFEGLQAWVMIAVMITVFSLAVIGVAMISLATGDNVVINHCEEQGWHNFGQTRIICSVEPKKKEAK